MTRAAKHGICAVCGRPKRDAFAALPVCRQACGHILALRLVEADPEVLRLLHAPGVYVRRDLESSIELARPDDRDQRIPLIAMAADVADIDPALAIAHLDAAWDILPCGTRIELARTALAAIPGAAP